MVKTIKEINMDGLLLLRERNQSFANFYLKQKQQNTDIKKWLAQDFSKFETILEYTTSISEHLFTILRQNHHKLSQEVIIQIAILLAYGNGVQIFFEKLDDYVWGEKRIVSSFVNIIEELNLGIILELTNFQEIDVGKLTSIFQKCFKTKSVWNFLEWQEEFWRKLKEMTLMATKDESKLYKVFLLYFFTAQAIIEFFSKLLVTRC